MGRQRTNYNDLPQAERDLAQSGGLGKPNSYVRAPDDPPYYPPEVLEFLRGRVDIVLGPPDDLADSIEGTRPNGNGATGRP